MLIPKRTKHRKWHRANPAGIETRGTELAFGSFGLKSLGTKWISARQIEAGSDMFLMPSHYEPCGLNQMISLKYGTIPIVRATGGLDDTIRHRENGFKFTAYLPEALLTCIYDALAAFKKPLEWKKITQTAFACDFSWNASAKEYVSLYNSMRKYCD